MPRPSATATRARTKFDVRIYAACLYDIMGKHFTTAEGINGRLPFITSTDIRLLESIQELYGGWVQEEGETKKGKQRYGWVVEEDVAIQFFKEVGPFMVRARVTAYNFLSRRGVNPLFDPEDYPY